MPKFEVFWESDLKEPLTEMGMSVAFDRQRADFAGIGMGNGNLYISKVQHKTYIKVDERGTEAAATNGFVGTLSRTRGQPFEMTVDHPFLFAIAERDTGAIAFIGTVTDLTNR